MAIILDGSSEHVAHIWNKSDISISLRHSKFHGQNHCPAVYTPEKKRFKSAKSEKKMTKS